MNYGEIKDCDIANGVGVRISLFVSGCRNHCKECFQPQTWDFSYGKPFTLSTEEYILNLMDHDYIAGLTILGGEPFEPENQEALLPFLKRVKVRFPEKTIWAYSGYTYEQMTTEGESPCCLYTDEVLDCVDILVDGRFVVELKNISLKFRGSENQRIIDVKKTREEGKIVLWQD